MILFLLYWFLVTIRYDSFMRQLYTMDSNGLLTGVGVRVRGKSDKRAVFLMLYADDECPEFCPITQLLVYIHLSGFKGALFQNHIRRLPFPQ